MVRSVTGGLLLGLALLGCADPTNLMDSYNRTLAAVVPSDGPGVLRSLDVNLSGAEILSVSP